MIRKLLCFIGLHHHVEMVDEELTREWFYLWNQSVFKNFEATPCTYLQCLHCGHTYESRTIGFSSKRQ